MSTAVPRRRPGSSRAIALLDPGLQGPRKVVLCGVPLRRGASIKSALALLSLAACTSFNSGPVNVVVIGDPPRIVDADAQPMGPTDAVLTGAVAQGLVRLDAGGQIVPGLAERWNVSDDGLSYIFRMGDARWPDGKRVTPRAVVRQLRAAAAPGGRNPLRGVLTGIEEIVATANVIEIRLAAPRPNLLHHLARPELAIIEDGAGAGPFGVRRDGHGHLRLVRSVPDGEAEREETVVLAAHRAAIAVALFDQGSADLVLGGTANDLPVARAADPPAAALRFDPAAGLFGLAVVDTDGPLANPDLRRALSMAVDRDALAAAIGPEGLQPRSTLTARGLSNLPAPAEPGWAAFPLDARIAEARRLVGTAGPLQRSIRVAIPAGPGFRLLFAHLRRDWARIGIDAVRVDVSRNADLRLVDEVAPSRGASWYLERFTCDRAPVCDPNADAALAASRTARDPAARVGHLAAADRLLAEAVPFIPLTTPVRWSLVSRRITGFRTNPFAVHSLTDLVVPRAR